MKKTIAQIIYYGIMVPFASLLTGLLLLFVYSTTYRFCTSVIYSEDNPIPTILMFLLVWLVGFLVLLVGRYILKIKNQSLSPKL